MRDRQTLPASRSPLNDLTAEVRALERRRRQATIAEVTRRNRARRFEDATRIPPGAWSALERTA